ncbi:hypothetical protein FDECE_8224 [Fusarium decemcellulare]|nr:hypothetical protein FDECE_8224 [Fusarium decemcellulare]
MAPIKFSPFTTLLFLLPKIYAAGSCYYPDGSLSQSDVPCNSGTEASACCAPQYKCLDNGLCQAMQELIDGAGASEYARGSCTDQNWKSEDCLNRCIPENPSGGADVNRCAGYTNRFYCRSPGLNGTACNSTENYFSFSGRHSLRFIYVALTDIQPKGDPSAITTILPSQSIVPEPAVTSDTKEQETTTASPALETETESAGGSGSSSKAAITGGAVGGAVGGVLLVALFVFWCVQYHVRKAMRNKQQVYQDIQRQNTAQAPTGEKPVKRPMGTIPEEPPAHIGTGRHSTV